MTTDRRSAATVVLCPLCGREIETFERDGDRLLLGHRIEQHHTPETPWCHGGGRRVAGN